MMCGVMLAASDPVVVIAGTMELGPKQYRDHCGTQILSMSACWVVRHFFEGRDVPL